ncbi:MAG: GDP-mannose 4,6-dehydratase, partial [Planctomycetota bacterium]|nr:GDP-mannose 4,6-dehydratase [Planctomycetota bacterium]
DALLTLADRGKVGEKYLVGSENEITNIDLVTQICRILDQQEPRRNGRGYSDLIALVSDRPGHDFRYAINPAKIKSELNWNSNIDFRLGLEGTVRWYLENRSWLLSRQP